MDEMRKKQLLCGAAGILLGVLFFFSENAGNLGNVREIERNPYGAGGKQEEFVVRGVNPKSKLMRLNIDELAYDSAHAEEIFREIREELPDMILQENESASQVRSPLYLPSVYRESDVRISWKISDPEVLSEKGEILEADPGGSELLLSAELYAGEFREHLEYELVVFPPEDTDARRFWRFEKQLAEGQFKTADEPVVVLPEEFEGKKITFSRKINRDFIWFPLIGIAFAVLMPMNERQKAADERKKYEKKMMLDYAEIISKMVIFTGAGMSMRLAWEKIALDYEALKKVALEGEFEERPAYEEICYAVRRLHRGVAELQVYTEFGERCRVREYRKLSSLIVQSLKNGDRKSVV